MASDSAPVEADRASWRLRTGVDQNTLYLVAGGVLFLAVFAVVRALGHSPGSVGWLINLGTGVALVALVPFIVAIYMAAREGIVRLQPDGLYVRVGFLVNATIAYRNISVVGGPVQRPQATYGVSPSYRRRELSLGRLDRAVEISLRRRMRIGTRWLFPFLRIDRIWLGVSEPESLIRALRLRQQAS